MYPADMARIRIALFIAAGLAGLALAHPAAAQMGNTVTRPVAEPANTAPPPEKLPPGLPGAQSQPGGAARPAPNAIPTDMPPTQALFDAINRGDIAGARDALNRGADIDARNVLGMTPLDSAIDLGRNDISFLLLSMRGEGGPPPPGARQANAAPPPSPKPARNVRTARRTPERGAERVAENTTSAGAEAPTPAAAQAPHLFAGDGGTPAPQVGFLGFGGRSR
jgi:hypothetical protein